MTVRGGCGCKHEQFRHADRQQMRVVDERDELVSTGGQQDQDPWPLTRVGAPAGTGG